MNHRSAAFKLLGRRLLHSGLVCALRLRSRTFRPANNHRYAVIAPHPDDETLGCGGLIATACSLGSAVDVIYLTDGSAALPDHPKITPNQLIGVRAAEARAALAVLGVAPGHVHFLGAPDGRLDHLASAEQEHLVSALAGLLARLRPDHVLVPWRHDGSSEHEAAFGWTVAALRTAVPAPRLLEYPVWAWWSPRYLARFAMTSAPIRRLPIGIVRDLKASAVNEFRSQIHPVPPWTHTALPQGFTRSFLGTSEYFVLSSH
jgi:LmbE family N-acetylglucosaminyl deacetylase